MTNNGSTNGTALPTNTDRDLVANMSQQQLQAGITFMGLLTDRMSMAKQMGLQYGGERDLWNELGYPDQLTVQDFEARYDRDGISGRIIDKPANDTWRTPPEIKDGDADSGRTDTEFVQAIGQLDDRLKLFKHLRNADRLARLGQYGVLLIGLKGADQLSEPAPDSLNGPQDVIYLRPFRQSQADIATYDTDPTSPRFGLPQMYTIDLGKVGNTPLTEKKVHWSRLIHIAEDSFDEVNGRPALERPFNRLMDLDKVVGPGAEAVWKLIYKGHVVTEKEGYDLSDSAADLEDEFLKLLHNFKRVVIGGGIDVKELGTSETPDPSGIHKIIISHIAADLDMPQNILIGSEQGIRASDVDAESWAGTIRNRQTQHAEPVILRPTLDWLIARKALPDPTSGVYSVVWGSPYELTDLEKAEIGEKKVNILAKAAKDGVVEFGLATQKEVRQLATLPEVPEGETVEDMLDVEDSLPEETAV